MAPSGIVLRRQQVPEAVFVPKRIGLARGGRSVDQFLEFAAAAVAVSVRSVFLPRAVIQSAMHTDHTSPAPRTVRGCWKRVSCRWRGAEDPPAG